MKYITYFHRNGRSLRCGRVQSNGIASLDPVWGTHIRVLLYVSECDRREGISLKPKEVVPGGVPGGGVGGSTPPPPEIPKAL